MGSEQKKRSQDQAVVDSEGNEFGVGEVFVPDRPKDLLEQIDEAQDQYYGAWVWHCCKGPFCCNQYLPPNEGHNSPEEGFRSVKVMWKDLTDNQRNRFNEYNYPYTGAHLINQFKQGDYG